MTMDNEDDDDDSDDKQAVVSLGSWFFSRQMLLSVWWLKLYPLLEQEVRNNLILKSPEFFKVPFS